MSTLNNKEGNISFYQGGDAIGGADCLKSIKQKIAELSNIKNISFLLGAGASSDAVPSMKTMHNEITKDINGLDNEIQTLYKSIKGDNLEDVLTTEVSRFYFYGKSSKTLYLAEILDIYLEGQDSCVKE